MFVDVHTLLVLLPPAASRRHATSTQSASPVWSRHKLA